MRVPHPSMVLHGSGTALACGRDGQIQAEEQHGLFAADTRVLSTYRMAVGGHPWCLLGRSRSDHATVSWEFQNSLLRDPAGDIPAGTLLLSLRRRLDGALHDDLSVRSFVDRPVRVRLTLQLDADFADIFEIRNRSIPNRPNVRRTPEPRGVALAYEQRGFRRGMRVSFASSGPAPVFVATLIVFDLDLSPGAAWTCCVEAVPEVDGHLIQLSSDPHSPVPSPVPAPQRLGLRTGPILQRTFERGLADFHTLAVPQDGHPPFVAAGVPWFLTLFGRDSLVAALMAGLAGAWSAEGALQALGELQATERDDWRDAEPGKLPHELRRGELAFRGRIPHTPYYGTHDTPALYCLALWHTWRWTGARRVVDAHLETARAALRWCDELGDRDGDGLQEYATRSRQGYCNQGWKDAGDAIVHADGRLAEPPLATVELQGYLYAARLALAELLEEHGDRAEAARLRSAAAELRAIVEHRFWLEDQRCYALALDHAKRPVASITSNPGHLLWCGLPNHERAAALAARLLEPDLFSGWGLRTLSSRSPAYNPLAYQRGSVWPHDTALAAAGLWRYGLYDAASSLIRALLEAASAMEEERLPELFCGLDRSHGLPVPYLEANSPQAWAAAVPILATQLFLGLVPDAPRGRCFLSPWLPAWLPHLELHDITIGQGTFDLSIVRRGEDTVVEQLDSEKLEVVQGTVEAPLWGVPLGVEDGDDRMLTPDTP